MESHITMLMQLIDDASEHLPNNMYLEMCNTIKKVHDASINKPVRVQAPVMFTPVPAPAPMYFSVSNLTLSKHLLKSGEQKGDIIIARGNYFKVQRKCASHITLVPATHNSDNTFTFNKDLTFKYPTRDESILYTVAYRRSF